MTISSLALTVFRKMTDISVLLGVEPVTGYNGFKKCKNQSKIAIEWLNEINEQVIDSHKFRWIYHPLGEKKYENYYVDGYDESEDMIYEFLGCYFHGCSDCFDLNAFNKKCGKTFGKLNSETLNRLKYLERRCAKIVVMKECKYLKNVAKKSKKIFNKIPIKIRDSLYGGRTSPAVLYKDCFNKGKIYYVDFVSLYPSVQYKNEFPVGKPIVTVDEDFIKDFFDLELQERDKERSCGFIKCKVLPPKNLYFPVLPARIDAKLIFPLCFECAKSKDHKIDCNHNQNQRSFVGTWCLHEIYKAIEQGYELCEIFEMIYYGKKPKNISKIYQ